MKKFIKAVQPLVKSATPDEEELAKANLSEEKDISDLISKGTENEAKDHVQRCSGDCGGCQCGNGRRA